MEGGCTAALGEFHTTAVFPSSGEMNRYPSTVEPQQNRMVLRGKHATRATIPLPDRGLAQAGCRCAARARRSQDTSPTHTHVRLLWPAPPAEEAGKSSTTSLLVSGPSPLLCTPQSKHQRGCTHACAVPNSRTRGTRQIGKSGKGIPPSPGEPRSSPAWLWYMHR